MPKDYAKKMATVHEKTPKNSSIIIGGFALFILLGMGIVFYLQQQNHFLQQGKMGLWFTALKHHASAHKESAAKPVEEEIRFDFYSELPNIQVNLPTLGKAKAPPAPLPKTLGAHKNQYILEIGTFNNTAEASQLRLSLLLAGIDTTIIKFTTANQSFYRVQQGPYGNENLAKATQRHLQQKGIESAIKQLG